ncbi:efflux RND transporter periplasmic adaptor subunit [Trinickia diaoshuihuensis]|uniref:efflux RND transporter periplasmic adaptor subunit n=1 Tax=Trinickia diaoshuihuensis TaxID=2292265 RepID=UPI000E22AB80|nr:efflux RND transporter periplasmic adaptor subunit [Trinickia diaoshuihuensis]
MKKRYVVLAVLAVLAGAGLYLAQNTRPADLPPPAVPVEAVAVALKDVPVYVSGLGTVVSMQTVTVRPQVDGQIVAIRFKEGQRVRANDVLVELDSRYLRGRVKQAAGRLERDRVLLANAERDLTRYRGAQDTGTVTQQRIDTQAATVAQEKAAVLADEGALEQARVRLDYCTIRSPATGVAGLRQVDVGNLVQTNDAGGIVTIVGMSPIAVLFTVPQKDIARVVAAIQSHPDAPVSALDADDTRVLATGAMEAIDNVVDQASGTIKLKAVFPNSEETLRPGEFVHARLRIGLLKQVPVVPSHAVLHGTKGDYVFVVGSDHKAKLVHVRLGAESHGQMPVTAGELKAGDLVITDGAARVSEHTEVAVRLAAAAGQRDGDSLPASEEKTP